jgi:hypothetical protein
VVRRRTAPASPPAWLVVGAIVDYHGRIGGPITRSGLEVVAKPWQLGDGTWVVKLQGLPGGVSIEAVTIAPVDVAGSRAAIAKAEAETGYGWVLGKPYSTSSMSEIPNVVDVLSEPDGAEILEKCMPEAAAFAVAAFNPKTGWLAALNEIERLRAEIERLRKGAGRG